MATRKPYPSDVSDEEWAFVAPYLALLREDAPQREYDLREVFNGLRWVVRTGSPWRYMPHDLPRGGWWSGISYGHRDFGGWRKITRGCPPLWRGCTSAPSFASSSSRRPAFSARVHNTL